MRSLLPILFLLTSHTNNLFRVCVFNIEDKLASDIVLSLLLPDILNFIIVHLQFYELHLLSPYTHFTLRFTPIYSPQTFRVQNNINTPKTSPSSSIFKNPTKYATVFSTICKCRSAASFVFDVCRVCWDISRKSRCHSI